MKCGVSLETRIPDKKTISLKVTVYYPYHPLHGLELDVVCKTKRSKTIIVKDPDDRIQEAIGLIFQKFREFWSIRQTFLWFAEEGIQLPVTKYPNGEKRIEWQIPTYSFIKEVLKNAFYAGAYVWGRRETQKIMENGRIKKRIVEIKPEKCKVFKPNHHQGYIDWKTFKENVQIMVIQRLNLVR